MNMSMASTQISTTALLISSHSQFNLRPLFNIHTKTPFRRLSLVQASKTPSEETNSPTENAAFISQEDLTYLAKIGAGSIAGAAAIKYGSVIFPDITRPNIVQALIMITAPVVVAVVLLVKQSRSD